MLAGGLHHGPAAEVGRGGARDRGVEIPAGEDPRQPGDVVQAIGLLHLAGHQQRRAIELELQQADAEQLHQFTGVVLVGQRAGGGVELDVAAERQVLAHRRVGRHRLQQAAVVAEGVGLQQIEERRPAKLPPAAGQAEHRHDDDFRQRQRHPLAQRIGRGDELAPLAGVEADLAVAVAVARPQGVVALRHQPLDPGRRRRQRHLLVQPAGIADGLDAGDLGAGGTQRGLGKEARRVSGGDAGRWWGRRGWCRHRCRSRAGAGRAAIG